MYMDGMKINMAQEMSRIDQYLLFLVILDLSMAYDMLDRIRLLQKLDG